jgi:hypothetical protein
VPGDHKEPKMGGKIFQLTHSELILVKYNVTLNVSKKINYYTQISIHIYLAWQKNIYLYFILFITNILKIH